MRRFYISILVWMFLNALFSCSTAAPGIFGKQSFHDQYGKKLTAAGLQQTTVGSKWFAAAEAALQYPAVITLPYKEAGYFAAEKPRAVGLKFEVRRGEKITIQVTKQSNTPFVLYADLWKAANKPVLKSALDTVRQSIDFEAEDNGAYIIRLQPELLSSGTYTLSVSVSAALTFPVAGKSARIASVWGDARDAGARRHEGIDIFAPKRTPAIAAANGIITAVNENTLGGKAVWLRPQGKDYVLYYAHLDEQLVHAQQQVHTGDTVGLVGNTGNARTTPSHLHFGVYASGGAIDPLPFVNPTVKQPQDVDTQLFKKAIRLATRTTIKTDEIAIVYKPQTFATAIALTATSYRVEFPDGHLGNVPIKTGQNGTQPIRSVTLKDSTFLLEQPIQNTIPKKVLLPLTNLSLLGFFNDFAFVETKDGEQGWVFEKVLNESASHIYH